MRYALKPFSSFVFAMFYLSGPCAAQSDDANKSNSQNKTDQQSETSTRQAPVDLAPMSLERIVVTGTTFANSKMKQSVSISTMEAGQIIRSGAANVAEILASVPGVHTESSGGEGNANVSVRGVPISAGGSRYVQFQEDGLPVLMFGDIAFATADQFIRADNNLDHIEVIRGGSASTLTSNAPGGIINFISKTGDTPGSGIALSFGIAGGNQQRLDADFGADIGNRTYFHIGGFNRIGEGDRSIDFTAANGSQLKASITQQLDSGYLRLNFKALDDHTPSFLPVPVYVVNGHIKTIAGIDPRSAFFISPAMSPDNVFNRDGTYQSANPRDGLHVVSQSFGLEAQLNFNDTLSVNNKFRRSQNSGRFIGLFPANNGDGPSPTTSPTFTGTLFNTSIDDLGNTINDFRLTKKWAASSQGETLFSAGLFSSTQTVALTWFWNQYTLAMNNSGSNATFLRSGWDTWGGCCVRNFDVEYHNNSPYVALNYIRNGLTVDASIRRDVQHAYGWAQSGDAITRNTWDSANAQTVDYSLSHTSFSIGANQLLSNNLAVFARASDGAAFVADRLLYGDPLDDSVPVSYNELKQWEAGAKFRHDKLNLFATFFHANTDENNYEATTQQFTANQYQADGMELEIGYRIADFRLTGGATLTQARIDSSNDANTIGNAPRRLAKTVLQLSPNYSFDTFEMGAMLLHNGRSYGDDANSITLPAYTAINAYGIYHINDQAQLLLGMNNVTNTLGYTEIEGDGHAARAINGRTIKLTLSYAFN